MAVAAPDMARGERGWRVNPKDDTMFNSLQGVIHMLRLICETLIEISATLRRIELNSELPDRFKERVIKDKIKDSL